MDETSPLYLAHQYARYAEKFLKKKDFDKSLEYHYKAIVCLQEAMTLTKYPRNLESLQLQHDYHLTQTNIIRAQKNQLILKIQKAEIQKKRKMSKRKLSELEQKDQELGNAIKGAIEETSALLRLLSDRGEASGGFLLNYMKQPKDEKTVVDELKTLNEQLKDLVNEVLIQLESSRKETENLKNKIFQYEKPFPESKLSEMPKIDFN